MISINGELRRLDEEKRKLAKQKPRFWMSAVRQASANKPSTFGPTQHCMMARINTSDFSCKL